MEWTSKLNLVRKAVKTVKTMTTATMRRMSLLLKLLAASYQALPIGGAFLGPKALIGIAKAGALIFSAGMLASLPIVVGLFLVTLLIGILTRVAPQLNIFSVGFAISILAGLVLLLVSLPNLTTSMANVLNETADEARALILDTNGAP